MPADLDQFLAPSRRRQADAQQMTIQIEFLVVDPHRVVQIELAVGQLCPELGYRRDP